MSVMACFPGKGHQALYQGGNNDLQWRPMQPVRYQNSPGSDSLPYSSSSEDDVTPQKPARFTPAEEQKKASSSKENPSDSITSSQQTTETTGTYESMDTTGTSRLQGLPAMVPPKAPLLEEERKPLAAVKEESAEGFEGSPMFKGLPIGTSPSSSVVLKKATIPEPSPVIWELQEYGDKRRQQLKKEAWQLKRYEHLLKLLKEGLIDQSDFQAHKKPIMRYMADTCSEPGRENKELEHDKLVFLKQLKEAECLTSSEYRLAKAPILRRLAGYRIVSPSRDKRKGGLRAILSKLKVHGLRHHSPPRSGTSTPCGSPPQGAKWKSTSNPYFTHSDPTPGGPFPPPNVFRRMASTAPFPVEAYSLGNDRQEKQQGKSIGDEGSDSPSQDLSGSPHSIRSPLDWPRRRGPLQEAEWTPKLGPVRKYEKATPTQKATKPASTTALGSEVESRDRGAFGSEFQVQGDGFGSRMEAPGKIPGSVSLDAGSSSRATSSDRTGMDSGMDSEFSGDQSVNGQGPNGGSKLPVVMGNGEHPGLYGEKGGATKEKAGGPGGPRANYPSRFLLALHSSGEFGGFTNPFTQPPLSEEFLDSPLGNEKEVRSDLESSPVEAAGAGKDKPLQASARQELFGRPQAGLRESSSEGPANSTSTTEADSLSKGESRDSLKEDPSTEFVLEGRPQGRAGSGRGSSRADLFGVKSGSTAGTRTGPPLIMPASAAADAFGTDVFSAQPVLKGGPPKKLQNVLSFPPSSGKAAGRPPSGSSSRPNSPPARAAPAVPRSQTLPSSLQSTKTSSKEGLTAPSGLFMGSGTDPRKAIPAAPSLASRKPIPEAKLTTTINVAKIAISRQAGRGPAAKQATVWNRLTGQNSGRAKKRAAGGAQEKESLLDSESEVSSEDELANPSMQQASRAPQVASEALTGKVPNALAQLRSRGEAARHMPLPPGRTERSADAQKQPTAVHSAASRQGGPKPQRVGTLHAVPESPDRAARKETESEVGETGPMGAKTLGAVEETESEASDEVLYEDESREVDSKRGARRGEAGPASEGEGKTGDAREEGRKNGHQRRRSRETNGLAGGFHDTKPAAGEKPPEAGKESLQKQSSQREERKASQEGRPSADVLDKVAEAAAQPAASAGPPRVPPMTGKVEALQRQASQRHGRKPSREGHPEEEVVETAVEGAAPVLEQSSAVKAKAPRYPEEHAARHERKKSRDLEAQVGETNLLEGAPLGNPPGPRYPEERAVRHERKKSRDLEKQLADTNLVEEPKRERDAEEKPARAEAGRGAMKPTASELKPPSGAGQRKEEKAPKIEVMPEPAAPVVVAAAPLAPPAAALQPQAPATAASSKLADLKARMASMRAAGPKSAAKPAHPAPSPAASVTPAVTPVEAPAPAPPPSNPPPIKAAEAPAAKPSNPAPESPQKETKAAMPAPAAVVVKEAREEVQPAPAPVPSAKMDVAARVAARMAARAQAAKSNGATAPQPFITLLAASAEAGSREAQLAATPEGAGVPAKGAPSGTVSKPEARSTPVPRPATHPAVPEDVDSARGARVGGLERERETRAGYETAPSSPRDEDSGSRFPSPPRQPRSQPSSPSPADKLLAMRRQVSTLGSSVKPPADEKVGPGTTATKAWPGLRRAKDAPPAFARSNSQGADSSNISESSKEGALAFTENIKKSFARLRMEKMQQKASSAQAAKAPEGDAATAPMSRGIEGALHETSRNTPAMWARVNKLKDGPGLKHADVSAAKVARLSGSNWQEEMQAAMQGKYAENISPEKSASVDTAVGIKGHGDNLRKLR